MYRRARPLLVACAIGLAVLAQAAGERGPGPRALEAGPEPMLVRIFAEIEGNRLDRALDLTDALLAEYPKFRLGHLIKGDLLLARTRPLTTFGNVAGAPPEQVAELREEAIARLRGYREKPSPDTVPRYLLQMPPEQKHAVVVDTRRSRLYVFGNEGGIPKLVTDYYITQGKLGAEKMREGDKKTPIGVYHVTASLPRERLTDFYGSGAFPINYPNEWDRREGRTGHGIWLHGTPSDTFSRPPKASDGCVVLANQDLDDLSRWLQIGQTPVIISDGIEWTSLSNWQSERASLQQRIETWRQDLERRDFSRFLGHYSPRFQAEGQDLSRFARNQQFLATTQRWDKVQLDDLSMFRSPGHEDMIVVTFDVRQAGARQVSEARKRQYWIREQGDWKIIYEGKA